MPRAVKEKGPKKKSLPKHYRDLQVHAGPDRILVPAKDNPLCRKCKLDEHGSCNPYLKYEGAKDPLITVVVDSVSEREDDAGELGVRGQSAFMRKVMGEHAKEIGFDMSQVRFASTSLCAHRKSSGMKEPNLKTKGGWCRQFLVQDIMDHRPGLIIPVGTNALGLLSHKSNANDWAGRTLTYRGWPDDWITEDFTPAKFPEGHPVLGLQPKFRVPMIPVMRPSLAFAGQNPVLIRAWHKALRKAMRSAMTGIQPLVYDRDWFRLTTDPDEVKREMQWLIDHPGTIVTYDTETTGLHPFGGKDTIVFMMMRWERDGKPVCLGWPWQYTANPGDPLTYTSPLLPFIEELTPYVLEALYVSRVRGHNLTFDVLFTYATLKGAKLSRLGNAMFEDTLHMLFTYRQKPGSLGLELVAYDWCQDMAGYEEEMTLLIDQFPQQLSPEKGGHYANCPPELWESHYKPYVMGDVEVCHVAADNLRAKLAETKRYQIPIAHPTKRGKFHYYSPPNRELVYDKIMAPSAKTLAKIMGRGMYVNQAELTAQEDSFPKRIKEAREKLRHCDERIIHWCDQQEATEPGWELDLESKDQVKDILFNVLQLPVERLTKTGRSAYGEDAQAWKKLGLTRNQLLEYAAADKFTLNQMAVQHPKLRVLLEYRKVHKLYTTYIRPLRNITVEGLDKKARTKHQFLMADGMVHASFLLTGTRGGRLSCRNPNLQNVAKDGEVKAIYASRFGDLGCMYNGDLSQIELRLLAAACGDASMVEAYWKGLDLHSLTTQKIFKIPYEKFSDDYTSWAQKNGHDKEIKELSLKRRIGKMVNFLTGYGGGALGLMNVLANQGIYLTLEECEDIIESFFDNYPSLKNHIAYYKKFIMDNGCAVSLTGRVRLFDDVYGEDKGAIAKALRAGYNHLIQSTASDMMLLCLNAIDLMMEDAGLESMLVSTVHDSLLIDAKRSELPQIHEIVSYVLGNIPEVVRLLMGDEYDASWMNIVPFAGDTSVGKDYLEEKKITSAFPDWDELLAA